MPESPCFGNSGITFTSSFSYYSTSFFLFSNQKGLFCRFLHSFSLPQQKKTPETSDYLRSSRSPNLRLDYDLIKSGPFMFQDIYLPCDTAVIGQSLSFCFGAKFLSSLLLDLTLSTVVSTFEFWR